MSTNRGTQNLDRRLHSTTDNNMGLYIGVGVAAFVTMAIIILIVISVILCRGKRIKTSLDHEMTEVGENTHDAAHTAHRNSGVTDGHANEEHGPGMNEFASDDTADYDVIDKNYKRNITPTIAVVEPFSRDINVTYDGKPATSVQKQCDPGIAEINMGADDTLANMYACVNKPKTRLTRNRNVEVESASAYDDVQTELRVPIRLRVDLTVNPRLTTREVNHDGDEITTTQVSDMYAVVDKRNSGRPRKVPTDRSLDPESVDDDDDNVPVLPPKRMSIVESEGSNQQESFVENYIYQSPGESDVDDAVLFLPNPLKDGNRGARTTEKTADNYEGFVDCAIYQSAEGADDDENNSQSQEGFVDNVIYESM